MAKPSSNTVPLVCSLCPKTPHFSDKSHLLTHISSKSHLSHRFKLQIRSQAEPEARQQLDEFETWYAENGLEDLLSERMATKDQKKAVKRHRNPAGISRDNMFSGLAMTDPVAPEMKKDKVPAPSTVATPSYEVPVPIMHTWATNTRSTFSTATLPRTDWESTQYTTPTAQRRIPNFQQEDSIASRTRSSVARANQTPVRQEPRPAYDLKGMVGKVEKSKRRVAIDTSSTGQLFEQLVDTSKLKGVYWPGMDLFDSATAEMRRNRNQKKDGSVLEKMMINSTEVLPDEWVFGTDGDVFKIRAIYGPSTDTSPAKTEVLEPTPRPRKRRASKRAPLADIDSNASLRGRLGSESPLRPRRRARPAAQLQNEALSKANPVSLTAPGFAPTSEEDYEFRLTVEEIGKKPFGIFRDASPGRTESPLEEVTFERTNSDLSSNNSTGLSNDSFSSSGLSNDGLTLYTKPFSSNNLYRPLPLRKYETASPQNGRHGGEVLADHMAVRNSLRRNLAATRGYPPQAFQDHSCNPLLYNANVFSYGDRHGMYGDENVNPFLSNFDADIKPILGSRSSAPPIAPMVANQDYSNQSHFPM